MVRNVTSAVFREKIRVSDSIYGSITVGPDGEWLIKRMHIDGEWLVVSAKSGEQVLVPSSNIVYAVTKSV